MTERIVNLEDARREQAVRAECEAMEYAHFDALYESMRIQMRAIADMRKLGLDRGPIVRLLRAAIEEIEE